MNQTRLDNYLVDKGWASTRSQAANYIKLGRVKVDAKVVDKPGANVSEISVVKLTSEIRYVSRAALKLESVVRELRLDFKNKTVLDVGSSTGGFTDYALQHGAGKVIAVDVGKQQMDPRLRLDPRIELHEQTDIRTLQKLGTKINYCLIDVSFISIRLVLKHLLGLVPADCLIIAMVKPQFESDNEAQKHKGVIKNENMRRKILKDFERWSVPYFAVVAKSDSKIAGPKGNIERFYLLKKIS